MKIYSTLLSSINCFKNKSKKNKENPVFLLIKLRESQARRRVLAMTIFSNGSSQKYLFPNMHIFKQDG